MGKRLEQLAAWNCPAAVIRLASGDLPHLAFASLCEPLRVRERSRSRGLRLDEMEMRPEVCDGLTVALWEHDIGDGHAFEVTYCARTPAGLEFWHTTYADDIPAPTSELVARTEQGLFFWLFFHLIAAEFFAHGEAAYGRLAAASKAVGFEHLVEVFQLEEEIGADYHRTSEVRQRALAIP